MTLDQQPELEEALRLQLYKVRRDGFAAVELERVPHLVTLAAALVPKELDPRRQLEISIGIAIESLSSELRKAAIPWFGLDRDSKDQDKDERERLAAATMFRKPDSFRNHKQKPIIFGIRRALLDSYGSQANHDGNEGAAGGSSLPDDEREPELRTMPTGMADDDDAVPRFYIVPDPAEVERERAAHEAWIEQQKFEVRARRLGMLLLVLLIGGGVGLYALIFGFHSRPEPVPKRGSVISAEDGSVVDSPDRGPVGQLVTLGGENTFRACDLSAVASKDDCKFAAIKGPVPVEAGDVLWIGQSLSEEGEIPLPFLTLKAGRHWENNHSAAATMLLEWPGVAGKEKERSSGKIVFDMPGKELGYVNLVYLPGTAELRGPKWQNFIARLPDGIMEGGISVANVGAPVSCFECFKQYKRYVFYRVRIEAQSK